MEFIDRLKGVLKSYRDGAHQDLIDDLWPVLAEFIERRVNDRVNEHGVIFTVRELEELLVVVRELKDNYDNLPEKTGTHVIRIDELRQLEYKLTEQILENR
jgi:hypothetical protein